MSEAKYRQAVAEFDRKVDCCRKTIPDICHRSTDTAMSHRPLLRQLFRDVLVALGSAYGSLAEALAPHAWPGLPQFGASTIAVADPAAVRQSPTLPELDLPTLPSSGLVHHRGLIERPPKSLSMFRAWRPHHLLLTTDGYVHCFRQESDVDAAKDPVWSMAPKHGTALCADPSTLKFTLLPSGRWVWRQKYNRVIRVVDSDSFAAWEASLSLHWQPLQLEAEPAVAEGLAASVREEGSADEGMEEEEETDREGDAPAAAADDDRAAAAASADAAGLQVDPAGQQHPAEEQPAASHT